MDLAVVMRQEVLADKLRDGRVHGRAVATWNTRRPPTRLDPGVDQSPLCGLSGTLARLLPAVGRRLLEPEGSGGALRPHL